MYLSLTAYTVLASYSHKATLQTTIWGSRFVENIKESKTCIERSEQFFL